MIEIASIKEQLENIFGTVGEENVEEVLVQDGSRHDIATTAAFLIGVPDEFLEKRTDIFDKSIVKRLSNEKRARVIRNLCMIRNAMFKYNYAIFMQMTQENKSLYGIQEIPQKSLRELTEDDVRIVKSDPRITKNTYTIEVNKLIRSRINDCRAFFPDWLSWEYVKNMFVMPNGTEESGIKTAGDEFLANKARYPYQCYVNGYPDESKGNILTSDKTFVEELYRWNGDEFIQTSRVQDIDRSSAKNISTFFQGASKIDIIVDCENSDPYRTCGCISTLNNESGNKIAKIILVNDVHSSSGWELVASATDIPVKEILLERIYEHKSMADMKIATETCREFFTNDVDSFILLSSDSDFWTLISSLPEARFIVMLELEKCGLKLREILDQNHYFYCFLNDFYSGDAVTLMNKAVSKNFIRGINESPINVRAIFESSVKQARTTLTQEQEDTLYKKLLNRLEFEINDTGEIIFRLK